MSPLPVVFCITLRRRHNYDVLRVDDTTDGPVLMIYRRDGLLRRVPLSRVIGVGILENISDDDGPEVISIAVRTGGRRYVTAGGSNADAFAAALTANGVQVTHRRKVFRTYDD